jgi:hypothetical protein
MLLHSIAPCVGSSVKRSATVLLIHKGDELAIEPAAADLGPDQVGVLDSLEDVGVHEPNLKKGGSENNSATRASTPM